MGSISTFQYHEMLLRLNQNRRLFSVDRSQPDPRETGKDGQHAKTIAWCDSQWPRWKYYHARTDVPSTLDEGVGDFCIFGPYPNIYLVEYKAKDGKLSEKQRIWITEMAMLGWKVNMLFSFQAFLDLVSKPATPQITHETKQTESARPPEHAATG